MKEYIIKSKVRNIRNEMIGYDFQYSIGELEPFYHGLAIFKGRNIFETEYKYHIVNVNLEDHFYKVFVAEKDTNIVIQRDKNWYFIVSAMEKCNYRTFPGKDRETEWDLRPIILAILDPAANLLSKKDMQVYITANAIKPYTSNGNDV